MNVRVKVEKLNNRIVQFPMNNNNYSHIPKISNIPKNNYDDRGLEKVKEKVKIETIRHLKNPHKQTKNKIFSQESKSDIWILGKVKSEQILEKTKEDKGDYLNLEGHGHESPTFNHEQESSKVTFYKPSQLKTQRNLNKNIDLKIINSEITFPKVSLTTRKKWGSSNYIILIIF